MRGLTRNTEEEKNIQPYDQESDIQTQTFIHYRDTLQTDTNDFNRDMTPAKVKPEVSENLAGSHVMIYIRAREMNTCR